MSIARNAPACVSLAALALLAACGSSETVTTTTERTVSEPVYAAPRVDYPATVTTTTRTRRTAE